MADIGAQSVKIAAGQERVIALLERQNELLEQLPARLAAELSGDLGRVVALALQATDRRRRRRSPLKPDHPAESMAEKA